MTSLADLAASRASRTLRPGELLITQGDTGGDLFVLIDGELAVERDSVPVATIATSGALVGEMSVLLGSSNSATVRAVGNATVKVIENARDALMADGALAFSLAALVAGRLDATTALLVDLSRSNPSSAEQGLLARILSAIHLPGSAEFEVTRHDLFR
ncbi:MAG TPA: cyclic nucleotide-binding domain-containing protein [Devosia sp.]|jgi:CRP-like cAMP-binding protein|nr:cyclic nucleotide-binding domain-containing protein [Devosia sp.]